MVMDPEDGAKKSSEGILEALLHDRGVQLSPSGDHPPLNSNPVSLHQVGMNAAAPDLPLRSMGEGQDEEYIAPPKRQIRLLKLLDLPTDILKEILSQVCR